MPTPPFTDPWLPAPGDDGTVASVRTVIPFAVYRIVGSPGSYSYTALPNVVCLGIEEHEGPAPSSAKFRYRFAGDDPAGPQSIEQALSTTFSGAHVVTEGDRLAVQGLRPDGVTWWIFNGYALAWDLEIVDDTERCVMGAVGIEKVCWDAPVDGAIYRNSQTPETVSDVPTDLLAQFNPRGVPNACPSTAESGTDPYTYPVFLDPLVKGTDSDGNDYPRPFTLDMAAAQLIYVNNTGELVANPERSTLNDLLVSQVPGGAGYDPNNPSTYTIIPIQVPDTPITGRNWPNILHDLLKDRGFGMAFALNGSGADPLTYLDLWRKQATTAKPVLLPARGSSFDPRWCNVGAAGLSRDLTPVVNHWRVRGALDRYEVSLVLAPGFPSAPGDAATLNLYDSADPAFADSANYNAYRLWVFDESGEGYYLNTVTTRSTGTPTSLDSVFGGPDEDGVPVYVARRRPTIGTLFTPDAMGRPLKARLAISTDYAGAYPAVWDGSGHWHEDCKGWQPLHDQIGIRIDVRSIPTPGASARVRTRRPHLRTARSRPSSASPHRTPAPESPRFFCASPV